MNGTVARCRPTDGADLAGATPLRLGRCQGFVASAQDRASAAQDPDIGPARAVATLHGMPRSLLRAAQRWLDAGVRVVARLFRAAAAPSSPSPATGRPVSRALFAGKAMGFREFTAPRAFVESGRSRLRVKAAGSSARVVPLSTRSRS